MKSVEDHDIILVFPIWEHYLSIIGALNLFSPFLSFGAMKVLGRRILVFRIVPQMPLCLSMSERENSQLE
jgi:hypothetical protein